MYDELVKALRHCAFWDCADCNYRPACADLTWEAADAIEELGAKYQKALSDIVKQAEPPKEEADDGVDS